MMFVYPVDILNFENTLHSHSHFAILGWLYNALYLAIVYTYVKDIAAQKKYNILFWITQVSIVGMLFTFAWQGYAAFSIAFSTMHIFCSYAFILFMLRDLRSITKETYSLKFIYGALFFLFLSSLGPWGLVAAVTQGLAGTDLYKQIIYFYLHFQYNGWFVFAVTGLWLKYFEDHGAIYKEGSASISFHLLFFSTIGAYFLSLLGFNIPSSLKFIGIACAFLQLNGIRYLYILLFKNEVKIFQYAGNLPQIIFRFSFFALFIKFLLQLFSALPKIGEVAFISREVTIGFIHLVMLGVITLGILGWFTAMGFLNGISKLFKSGVFLFIAAFSISEVLLFYPALVIWFHFNGIPNYTYYLFILALLMLASAIIIFISSLRKRLNFPNNLP